MNLLVVSPHMDDAVFSLGQALAEHPLPVLTVFAGCPPRHIGLSDYDASCGFSSSIEAWHTRLVEDDKALALLGCPTERWDMLDLQYRNAPAMDSDRLGRKLAAAVDRAGADGLLGPLGLQHPDHASAAAACRSAAEAGVPTLLYEELPYRVIWPELACEALAALRRRWTIKPDHLGAGPLERKAEAIAAYASQNVDEHCCLVPERVWRLCA